PGPVLPGNRFRPDRYRAPFGAVVPSGAAALSAADELDDFDLRARGKPAGAPLRPADDAAVELNRDARGIEPQFVQELQRGAAGGSAAGFTVDYDPYCGAVSDWLTVHFANHYRQS